MQKLTRLSFLSVGALALLSLAVLSGHSMTAAVQVDGELFEGQIQGSHIVVADYEIQGAQIELAAVEGMTVDVLFAPIELAPGESFSAVATDDRGARLAVVELVQTGETTTSVMLNLDAVKDRLLNDSVTLRARSAAGGVKEVVVPAAGSIKIGEVQSTKAGWAKTYHVLCMEGECTVALDPDNTWITFEADQAETVPFQFLEVDFSISH